MFSLPALEHSLVMYVTSEGKDTFATPFDLSKIPVVSREQADADDRTRYFRHLHITKRANTLQKTYSSNPYS